jgi:hypothetical protein
MTARIDGYAELLAVRGRNLRPDTAVLLTDSEVIEFQWREILRDSHPTFRPRVVGPTPGCTVLRIRNETPHNLIALRGLEVLAMLTRASSLPWMEQVRQAKPGDLVEVHGAQAYAMARMCAQNFLIDWLSEGLECA